MNAGDFWFRRSFNLCSRFSGAKHFEEADGNALTVRIPRATPVRSAELYQAQWEHVDLDQAQWHIPKSKIGYLLDADTPAVRRITPHDLRSLMKSRMRASGAAEGFSEMCLNQKLSGVEGIYDWHTCLEERMDALAKRARFPLVSEAGGTVVASDSVRAASGYPSDILGSRSRMTCHAGAP